MIGNIGRAASNIGSQVTNIAMGKAQRVALGDIRKMADIGEKINSRNIVVRTTHRGSSAGYVNNKSAYLAPPNAGYANPAVHKARVKSHTKQRISKSYPEAAGTSFRYDTINNRFDSREYSRSDSSVCRIKKLIR